MLASAFSSDCLSAGSGSWFCQEKHELKGKGVYSCCDQGQRDKVSFEYVDKDADSHSVDLRVSTCVYL